METGRLLTGCLGLQEGVPVRGGVGLEGPCLEEGIQGPVIFGRKAKVDSPGIKGLDGRIEGVALKISDNP
jgi:hypothetical protein